MADDSLDLYPAHLHPHATAASPYGSSKPPEGEGHGGSGQAPEVPVEPEVLRERVIAALRTVYDPEIPLNIYDLGLIYKIDIDDRSAVEIDMTLTAPGCPVAGPLVKQVADVVGALDAVSRSHVKLVWDPQWTQDRMSEEAQLELGLL
jgi:FeS assembly SUF system protein